jgi:hypothetical protein
MANAPKATSSPAVLPALFAPGPGHRPAFHDGVGLSGNRQEHPFPYGPVTEWPSLRPPDDAVRTPIV